MSVPVFALLSASSSVTTLIGTDPVRAFPSGRMTQGQPVPAVTWQVISGQPESYLAERAGMDYFRVQVDCWANTNAGANELAVAVREALEDGANNVLESFNPDDYEPETERHRVSFDFSFWVDRDANTVASGMIYTNPPSGLIGLTSGEALAARIAVIAVDGEAFAVDPTDADQASQVVGITTTSAAQGEKVLVRSAGVMTFSGWAWAPGPIFYTTAGALTQTLGADVVCEVARALDATSIVVDVKSPG